MRTTLRIALIGLAVAASGCSGSAASSQGASPGGSPLATNPTAATATPATASPATPTPATPNDEPTGAPSPTASEVATMRPEPFTLTSGAFAEGGTIPRRFTCDGENVSPDLSWSGAPAGTKALVLIVLDPDARNFVHWLAYDLAGVPAGGLPIGASTSPGAPAQGTNDFGKRGYGGPCPPSGTHHYRFTLSALDRAVEFTGTPRIHDLLAAMAGHVLAEAALTARYRRS
jgi:Raf kinase inhibitor-like YbhB/YbcL family protein